ncbi:hypothetical protein AB0E27_31530 [Streptomyces sparsogenes]|uniref:phage tail protein n=1 Tax=Streptomyces sparsogenes TaxID=67365 RepID=UPI0034012A94
MPAGQVIGRVSVRVLPDTDSFRRQAQKDLDRIEKQLEVKVEVKPVLGNFLSEMLREIRKINQQNRQTDSRKVRIYTKLALSNISEELRKAIRRYEDVAKSEKVQLKTTLDTTDIDVKISDKSLRDMTDQLKDWRDRNSPQKITIQPDLSATSNAATSARLALLTRPRKVSIVPELNNAALAKVATALAALSGMRVVNELFENFGNILRNLDKSVPIIGTMASAIAGLAALALTSASNLFALSASLAQIGAVGLTLPGVLGGFAVGIGVTVAALKDFNKEVPEVKQALSGLQDQISSNFWAQAREPIRELVDELLPRFARGFRSAATEIGKFFGSFATDLTKALDPGLVDKMFGYLNESIKTATGGTKTFASIIAQLGEVGASYLPDLAGWFVNISKEFDAWLKKKGQLGLKAEINEGIQSLKDLGGVLYETGGILAGVARAAEEAGGSTLGMLRDTLRSIHETVDSEGFQRGMVDVFKAAHQAMSNLATQAGPAVKNLFKEIGDLLTTVLPQAGEIIGTAVGAIADALAQPAVTEGVKAVFDGLLGAVQALAPAMAPLGEALGAIMQLVGEMLPVFAALVSAAVIPLAGAFAQIAPQVTPLIALLGGALTQAFQALGPYVERMVPVVGKALSSAFAFLAKVLPPIAELFGMIMEAVAPLAKQLVNALAPILPILAEALVQIFTALQPIVKIALEILTAVIEPLLPMLSEVIQSLLPPLADAVTRVAKALEPLLEALLAVVEFIMPVLVPVIEFLIEILAGALVGAIEGVGQTLEGLQELFVGVWDFIVGFFKTAWGIFEGLWTGNWDTFKEGFSQLWDGIWGIITGAWDIIVGGLEVFLNVGILGTASKAFKVIGKFFESAWKGIGKIFTDAFSVIRGYVSLFFTGAGRIVTDGLASIGTFFSTGWATIRTAASEALTKLVSTVGEWIGKAVEKVAKLPGKAKTALADLGSTLLEAGKSLIKGFIKGIGSMFGAVKRKLGSLTSSLTDWKGPETLDRVILVNAGQLVIEGFIRGLESRYDAVRKSLAGLTADVAGTEFEVPGVNAIGVSGGVSSVIGGALSSDSTGGGVTKVLNYYAAPGSSLGSEEDLFAAANRARFGW